MTTRSVRFVAVVLAVFVLSRALGHVRDVRYCYTARGTLVGVLAERCAAPLHEIDQGEDYNGGNKR